MLKWYNVFQIGLVINEELEKSNHVKLLVLHHSVVFDNHLALVLEHQIYIEIPDHATKYI